MLTSRAVLVTIAALLMLLLEPVVGGLVGLAATVVGLGALAVALWRARTPSGPATLEPGPAPGRRLTFMPRPATSTEET